MIKPYKYKIGDKVKFHRTTYTGEVINRFHPRGNPQFNSYVVELDKPQYSEAHGLGVSTAAVSEEFLVEPTASEIQDPEPALTRTIDWIKWYRRQNNCGLGDAYQAYKQKQGFRY